MKPGDYVQFKNGKFGGDSIALEKFSKDYVFLFKSWYTDNSRLVTLQGVLDDGTVIEPVVLLRRLEPASTRYDPSQQPYTEEDI